MKSKPVLADLRDLAAKWDVDQVIVLAINKNKGQFMVNSYGRTKALCDEAKRINDQIYNMINECEIELE